MAVEIINHEFNMTIREIRARIQDLGAWARSNPKLQPLYQEIRQNFEHLDSYLNLFTPLYRRLYRQETEISGQAIANFLVDLFEDRLRRHGISLIASPDFKKVVIKGYPSTFYPVFINLVDNAIFWLQSKSGDREIHLDADKQTLVVGTMVLGFQSEIAMLFLRWDLAESQVVEDWDFTLLGRCCSEKAIDLNWIGPQMGVVPLLGSFVILNRLTITRPQLGSTYDQ